MLQELGDSIKKQEKKHIVITGDFNSKHSAWGSRNEDVRGRTLLDWITQHKLVILNMGTIPTCSRSTGESVIDISLCTANMTTRVREWKVYEDLETLSDHRYILIKPSKTGRVRLGINKKKEGYPRWNLREIDEDLFGAALIAETWNEKREYASAERASTHIWKILRNAADTAMPRVRNNRANRKSAYWWTQEISEARKKCVRIRRQLKRKRPTASEEDLSKLRIDLKSARIELRNLIHASKSRSWNEMMESIKTDPWGRPFQIVMEKFGGVTVPVSETLEKDLLSSVLDYLFPNKINVYPEVSPGDDDNYRDISMEELVQAIHRSKNKVSPGPDGISSDLISRAVGNVKEVMLNVYNTCLKSGRFPKVWKEGRVYTPGAVYKPDARAPRDHSSLLRC